MATTPVNPGVTQGDGTTESLATLEGDPTERRAGFFKGLLTNFLQGLGENLASGRFAEQIGAGLMAKLPSEAVGATLLAGQAFDERRRAEAQATAIRERAEAFEREKFKATKEFQTKQLEGTQALRESQKRIEEANIEARTAAAKDRTAAREDASFRFLTEVGLQNREIDELKRRNKLQEQLNAVLAGQKSEEQRNELITQAYDLAQDDLNAARQIADLPGITKEQRENVGKILSDPEGFVNRRAVSYMMQFGVIKRPAPHAPISGSMSELIGSTFPPEAIQLMVQRYGEDFTTQILSQFRDTVAAAERAKQGVSESSVGNLFQRLGKFLAEPPLGFTEKTIPGLQRKPR